MSDHSLFIAGLTGLTAIAASSLASWLTSRGNAHAVRIQADASAATQRRESARQARRNAYLDLLGRAQTIADGLSGVEGAFGHHECADPSGLARALEAHREHHQHLRRAVRVIDLEGPSSVSASAAEVETMSARLTAALAALVEAETDENRREFLDVLRVYLRQIRRFVQEAADGLERT